MTVWNGIGEEMLSLGQIGPKQITWQNVKRQFVYAFSLGPFSDIHTLPISITGIVHLEMKIVIYQILFINFFFLKYIFSLFILYVDS